MDGKTYKNPADRYIRTHPYRIEGYTQFPTIEFHTYGKVTFQNTADFEMFLRDRMSEFDSSDVIEDTIEIREDGSATFKVSADLSGWTSDFIVAYNVPAELVPEYVYEEEDEDTGEKCLVAVPQYHDSECITAIKEETPFWAKKSAGGKE